MNIGEALPRNAQHFPRKPALVDKWRSVTHLDLHLRTNRIANYLLKTGIVPGDVVGLSCGNRCEHFEILFALAKIGAIAAPFDHNWSSRESQAMIAYFQPKAFFLEERKENAALANILNNHLDPKRVICIDGPQSASGRGYDEPLSSGEPSDPPIQVDGKDVFLIMITSGTTGFPKGCISSHEAYVMRALNNAIAKSVDRNVRALITLPLQFNAGRGTMIGILYLGGTVHIQDRFDEAAFLNTIEQERITYTMMVPTICDRLLRYGNLEKCRTSSLDYIGITGGHLTREAAEGLMEKLNPNVYQAYASTDCGVISLLTPEEVAAHSDTVGRPIWCVLLRLENENGNEVPVGTEGEICVRSPLAIQGYYRNPEATEEFLKGGWCHTGDIGCLDGEGYLRISGRKKSMIKSGGISLFPEEIEEVLRSHPHVEDVAVIGFHSPEWGEAVKALVVKKEGADCDSENLILYCKESLASYKAPKAVEFVPALPKTGLGKIDRGRLASLSKSL